MKNLSIKAFIASLIAACVVVLNPSSSMAVAGCSTPQVEKLQMWTRNITFTGYVPTDQRDMQLQAHLSYYHCPTNDPEAYRKISIASVLWCWKFLDPHYNPFDGVKFNSKFRLLDNGKTIDPPQIKVDDDGTMLNCERQSIAMDGWWRTANIPQWKVDATVVFVAADDKDYAFSPTWKTINPLQDPSVGSWFRKRI